MGQLESFSYPSLDVQQECVLLSPSYSFPLNYSSKMVFSILLSLIRPNYFTCLFLMFIIISLLNYSSTSNKWWLMSEHRIFMVCCNPKFSPSIMFINKAHSFIFLCLPDFTLFFILLFYRPSFCIAEQCWT